MDAMSFLRRSIFATLFLSFLFAGGLSYGLLWALNTYADLEPWMVHVVVLSFLTLLCYTLVYS